MKGRRDGWGRKLYRRTIEIPGQKDLGSSVRLLRWHRHGPHQQPQHAWGEDLQDRSCTGATGAPTGVYEVQLPANGNLKFVSAQDGCQNRREILSLAEWEPVS